MKMRKSLILVSFLAFLSLTACAQTAWWLFPGSKQRTEQESKNSTRQEQQTAGVPETTEKESSGTAQADSLAMAESENFYMYERSDRMRICMMLPLHSPSGKPNSNFLEMYSGALLALKDLGDRGMRIDFEILDTSVDGFRPEEHLTGCDVVIGPVEYSKLSQTLPFLAPRRYIVSPLDPKASALCTEGRLIHTPVHWTSQIEELVKWLRIDRSPADEVVVLKDVSMKGNGEQSRYMCRMLDSLGVRYLNISDLSELQEGRFGKYRLLIASDDDAFITKNVKTLGLKCKMRNDIILYTTSRVRNCVGPNVTDLYLAQTRLTAAYFIDYSSQDVKDFILAYRSLFRNEPGSFAFQGYDLVTYFANAYDRFGRRWALRITDFPAEGLQSDFEFDRLRDNGRVNHAVRKVIYNKDLSTTLIN